MMDPAEGIVSPPISQHARVLWCGQCNKPFDKQSTLKRHGYYCRSRRVGASTRARSCVSCARGKSGCDNRRPECSRCKTKGVECHYPGAGPASKDDFTGQHADVQRGHVTFTPSGSSQTDSSNVNSPQYHQNPNPILAAAAAAAATDTSMAFDGTLPMSDQDFASIRGEYLGWDDAGMGLADFLPVQASSVSPYLPPVSPPPPPFGLATTAPSAEQPLAAASSPRIPRAPSAAVRSLVHRPKKQPGTQRTANLILHTLKSYPLMMRQGKALPPFIHQGLVACSAGDAAMEPLTNCISLVQMISGGIQGSRKLFWKNVRMECERLCEEHQTLSKWELLAAMQALTIYVLMRLDEGETEHNNVDFLLVRAVTVIAQRLPGAEAKCQKQCALCDNGLEGSWKEWVFRESRRRLAVVYRVVNMLIYFEPASMCDLPKDLVMAPLPAKRELWEARDGHAWRAQSQRGPGPEVAFGLASDGELVRLDERRLSCSDAWLAHQSSQPAAGAAPSGRTRSVECAASWEEWCAGIDGFGALVMLAASLVV